jgi:beta-glucanase (GH16 family)
VNKRSLQYGLVDIRAKLPSGKGIWPALFLLGAEYSPTNWPACGEIDVAELNGNLPATVIGKAYYSASGPRIKEGFFNLPQYTDSFSDQFHIFSVLWQPDEIVWYVDYTPYIILSRSDVGTGWPFNGTFFFYLDLAVGGSLVGDPDDTTGFPKTLEVDYIRAFQPM